MAGKETFTNYEAKLSLNRAEFDKEMDKAASDFEGFSSKMSSIGSSIAKGLTGALAAGVTAMTALTTKALSLSGELEQNMGGSEAVFKEYAATVQDTAKQAAVNMGLSTSEYLANANKMGALLQGSGFDIQESMDISAAAMQRAADVASIMGIDVESAMEAVTGAAKGNYTMMDNLGVAMNDTALNAYALEKGIGKTTQEMSQQEKVALAMQMFLEKTEYAAGNYAKENETLAGSLNTAKAALTNFLDGSGDVDTLVSAFTNAANVIIEQLNGLLPRLVTGITGVLSQVAPMLPGLLQALLPAIVQGAVQLINGLVAALPGIVSALMTALPTLIEGVQQLIAGIVAVLPELLQIIIDTAVTLIPTLAQALLELLPVLLETFLSMMEGLAQSILDAIPVIIAALPELINQLVTFILGAIPQIIETGISLLTALVEALPTIIETIVAVLPQIIESIITNLLAMIPQIVDAGITLLISLVQALPTIITTIIDAVPKIVTSICDVFINNIDKIIDAGVTLFIALVENLPTIIVEIVKAVPQIITSLVNAIVESVPKIAEAGTNLVQGLFNGISNAVSWLYGKLKGWVSSVLSYIKSLFGIHSPSKETAEDGKYLVQGLGQGIEKNTDEATDAADKMGEKVLDTFDEVAQEVADIESGMFEGGTVDYSVKGSGNKADTTITNAISGSVDVTNNSLLSTLSSKFDKLITTGESMLDRLSNVVGGNAINAVTSGSRSIVIKMGDISVSGVLDKDAAEQVRDIAQEEVQDLSNMMGEVVAMAY